MGFRGWKSLRAIAIVGGLALYTLAFGEIFVRLMEPQSLMPRYVTGTPWGVRGNIRGARYRHRTPEVDVEYRINDQGFRSDRAFAFAKPARTCRIGLFGDSFFLGYELDLKDSLARKVESGLISNGFRVEVLNFSVSGFGTAEMLRTYLGYGRRFNLDAVIFEFHSTDLDDNVRSGLYRLSEGRLVPDRLRYLPGVRLQDALMRVPLYAVIADNSQLYAAIRQRAALATKKALAQVRRDEAVNEEGIVGIDGDGAFGGASGDGGYSGRLTGALLLAARDVVRSDGGAFFVVDIPSVVGTVTFRSYLTQIPQSDLASLHVVSSLGRFVASASPTERIYFEKGARHLTPKGARLLAEDVVRAIQTDAHIAQCR